MFWISGDRPGLRQNCPKYKRAARNHRHKKLVRAQKQHLKRIKSEAELRRIVLGGRGLT